ncbi:MAG TPA: signal peptide peptidase SppA, partial [Deltaproteobacteria bacterium]|nr:signal peptide peptidase SppA [Deltaproteobacteria bacterium]
MAGFFLLLGIVSRMGDMSFLGGGKVGIVPIIGLIADSEPVIGQIRKFAKDDSVKAIVLRI